jgi:hypothetical protein
MLIHRQSSHAPLGKPWTVLITKKQSCINIANTFSLLLESWEKICKKAGAKQNKIVDDGGWDIVVVVVVLLERVSIYTTYNVLVNRM